VWVSCKVYFSRSTISLAVLFVISVYFSRSTISLAVLFVISFYLLIRSLSRSYELQHYRLRSLAVLVSLLTSPCASHLNPVSSGLNQLMTSRRDELDT